MNITSILGVVLGGVVAAGCTATGAISSVEIAPGQQTVCDASVTPNVCGVPDGQAVSYLVRGKGNCSNVMASCGNGLDATPYGLPFDFGPAGATTLTLQCSYQRTYPGPKTVDVHSNGSDCIGEATLRVNVLNVNGGTPRSDWRIGYGQPGPTACQEVPGSMLPLRKNTRVKVKTNPDPNVRINFGCFGGCAYDADGDTSKAAGSGFPFPALHPYSLVLTVGNSGGIQGGTNTSFVTTQSGLLSLCVNDDNLGDNSGAWGVFLSIDESQATP
jgi:hypothetical protein